ncbi:MAG: NAD-dependent epimerase/dehydratase family protein [Deltaproteobacteria bacterium]|nr:NAD-dependent epimerase/dehydratase family protein [Deltaproteobacteria bacterium]
MERTRFRSKSIFIAGGAGFIGSHLVEKLIHEHGVRCVVVFDNFSSGSERHLRGVRGCSQLRTVRGDLKDLETIKTAMTGCDVVFHLAANPDIAKAVRQPDIDFWEGTYLTSNVLEAMRITGATEIFYTSGSGVYGEDPSVAFREDHGPCLPISTYGASKLACEALICAYGHMFEIKGRSFRFANVVGPRQTHGVGYDFVRFLRRDPFRLRILGDGTQTKSYIHVEDVLEAILLVSERCEKGYEVYNVATDDSISVTEIADLAVQVSNLPQGSVRYEYSGGDRGWKGDVPVVRFDVSRIKKLGWRARRSSREALTDSIKAMREELEEPSEEGK